jgi:hypothetical protein
METQSLRNKDVTVSCFGGSTADMIVLNDLGDVLVLASPDEIRSAKEEDREPVTIGFPRSSVLSVAQK